MNELNKMLNKSFLVTTTISILTTGFKVVIPWKRKDYGDSEINHAYTKGWNDCIKETKKQRSAFMKMVKSASEKEI